MIRRTYDLKMALLPLIGDQGSPVYCGQNILPPVSFLWMKLQMLFRCKKIKIKKDKTELQYWLLWGICAKKNTSPSCNLKEVFSKSYMELRINEFITIKCFFLLYFAPKINDTWGAPIISWMARCEKMTQLKCRSLFHRSINLFCTINYHWIKIN